MNRKPNPPVSPKPSISTPRKFTNNSTNNINNTNVINSSINTNNNNNENKNNNNYDNNNNNNDNHKDNNNGNNNDDKKHDDINNNYTKNNFNNDNDKSNDKNDDAGQYMKSDSFSALFSTTIDDKDILHATDPTNNDSMIEIFPQTEHFHCASPPKADKEMYYQKLLRQRNLNRNHRKQKSIKSNNLYLINKVYYS